MGYLIRLLPDELTILLVLCLELIIILQRRHVRRSLAAAKAFASVCAITELHEMILQQLTFRELLRAKRVCRKWNETIATSHPLLQKQWLRPTSKARIAYQAVGSEDIPQHAWLLSDGTPLAAPNISTNPLFRWEVVEPHYYGASCWWADQSVVGHRREMYICDPPATSILLCIFFYEDRLFEQWVHEAGGVRMKHVIDLVLPELLECDAPSCWEEGKGVGLIRSCWRWLRGVSRCRRPEACDEREVVVEVLGAREWSRHG
ncbi:hypothetical protein LTR36_001486 [Oleoguttula mirabilis]|uniref:F-box domain-containing protein n=1 Tax=Oleoguttula mirabilis TaxID=1507867 RepID=A0AAV9JN30_9PEZI|nr:hypothetical protein LTR36_001486 [Oleoguttula mirabilis]